MPQIPVSDDSSGGLLDGNPLLAILIVVFSYGLFYIFARWMERYAEKKEAEIKEELEEEAETGEIY